ncbi:MAG: shikimate kinase [Actinomycetota bacterium]
MTVPEHIVVIGPMGVGKTTTAVATATALGRPVRDSDADIEADTGRTGRAIAEADGVPALHALEAAVLLDALGGDTPSVIAAAASVVDREDCRRALAAPFVVTLDLDPEPLLERIGTGRHRRSITLAEIAALIERREPALAAVADLRLDARRPADQLVRAIVAAVS